VKNFIGILLKMKNLIALLLFACLFIIWNSQRNLMNDEGCPRHGMYRDYQPNFPSSLISPNEPYYEYDNHRLMNWLGRKCTNC